MMRYLKNKLEYASSLVRRGLFHGCGIIDASVFTISRKGSRYFKAIENGETPSQSTSSLRETNAAAAKPSSFKWVCPSCDLIVRSSKQEINVICGDCNEQLEKE